MALVGKSLDAVTGDATGTVISFDTPKTKFGVQIDATGFTSFATNIEVSIDGVTFYNPRGLGDASGIYNVDTAPILHIRVNSYYCVGEGTITAIVAAKE